jgi:hypothetical protein
MNQIMNVRPSVCRLWAIFWQTTIGLLGSNRTRFMSQTIFKTDGRTGNRYLRVRIPLESANVEGQGHGFGRCRDDEYGPAWTGTRSTSSDRTLRLVSCYKPDSNSRTLPLTALESTSANV